MNVFDLVATLKLDKSDYEKGLKEAGDEASKGVGGTIASGLGTVAKVGAAALATASTAVVAFGKDSVETGMEFDKAMAQVAATMGKTITDADVQRLSDFAQVMGAQTAFTATEAAEALNYMALAGYDTQTSINMLPNVLNLAAAGSIDLAYASDMITDSQTALGLSLDETNVLVDQMAKTASTTNTSVEQLGEAMLTIGGTAKFMKGGTEELNQVLGILADNGIKGSEAGTHLRNMLLKLSSPTSDGAVLLEKFSDQLGHGLVFDEKTGEMRSFMDIFQDLNVVMEDFTDEEKMQAFSDLFNTRDVASATALLGTTAERWEDVAAAIDDAQGSAEQMAKTQLDNLAGDVTLFKSALDGAKIAISSGITPVLREFVQAGTEGMASITEALQAGDFDAAVEAIGDTLTNGIDLIISMLPDVIETGATIIESLVTGLLENMPNITDSALQIITTLLLTIASTLPQIMQAGIDLIINIANGLTQQTPTLMPIILNAIMQMVNLLLQNAPQFVAAAITLMTALAQGLIEYIPTLITQLPQIIQSIVETLTSMTGELIEAALTLIIALGAGLIKAIPTLILNIPDIIIAIVNGLLDGLGNMADVGLRLVEGLWNGISDAADWVIGKIKGFGDKILSGIKSFFGIHSPSTVFAEIGEYMAEGLGVGWTDSVGDVLDQMTDDMDVEGNVTMNASVGDVDSLEAETSAVGGLSLAGMGDIIIPVYIGQSRLDEVIISNEQIRNYRSGGR